MGRGKRQSLSSQDREALAVFADALAGHPEVGLKPWDLNAALQAVDRSAYVQIEERGQWLYFKGRELRDYDVVGKYLFFARDPERLVPVAARALLELGFHHAKVSRFLNGWPNYVLCVYWKDDARLEEMAALAEELGVDYGGWKTDEQTRSESLEERARLRTAAWERWG